MTPRIRAALYAAIAGAIGVLLALGIISGEQEQVLLQFGDSVLNLVAAGALAYATGRVTEDSWATLRRTLYAAAAALMAGLGVFGLIEPDATIVWLQALDGVLSVVGMLLLGVATAKTPDATPRRAAPETEPGTAFGEPIE